MPDGFSAFIGAIALVIAICIIGFACSITGIYVRTTAISDGYFKQDGKLYSVKQATALKVE